MKLLNDAEICKAIGWKWVRRSPYNVLGYWSLNDEIVDTKTPDFSTPGPWHEFVIPWWIAQDYTVLISSTKLGYNIHICKEYNKALIGKDQTFPEAMRDCLAQLTQGEI